MELYWLSLVPIPFFTWLLIELVRDEAIPIPLPKDTIRQMLKLAKVSKKDVVYDLGSGDGRIVRIAAKEFGAKAVGVEKNRLLVWLSRKMVGNKGRIVHGDIFEENLNKADVIVMYLSHKLVQQLKPKLEKELKKGAGIVSASHPIEGWKEVERIRTGHFYSYLYKIS
ncbi:MAG: class I SAM-dependent methyltransferase [Candidatus Aenigmarchaeota archaeon]|nr:class I SAM-dependent methyltransferase [Candidatus Aenigmarchaeota archaeon]